MNHPRHFSNLIQFAINSRSLMLVLLSGAILAALALVPRAHTQSSKTSQACRPEGAKRGCNAQGQPGEQFCDGGVWTVCVASPKVPPSLTGTVTPKYYILTVVYSPPGTNGGKSSSSVNYGESSTIGSTVSSSDTFKQGTTVTATASGGILGGPQDQAGVSFGVSNSSTNGQSLDIKQTSAGEINDVGPGSDGVNHDHDVIYVWLAPQLQVRVTPASAGRAAQVLWSPANAPAVITYFYAAWLKNPSQMPTGQIQLVNQYGLTSEDLAQILSADPFAATTSPALRRLATTSRSVPDPNRFATQTASSLRRLDAAPPSAPDPNRYQLYGSLPYEPPLTPADPVPTDKHVLTFTSTSTSTSSTQEEYSVGLTLQSSGDFFGLFTLALKDQSTWTWTSTQAQGNSTASTETATVVIGGPAFGYQGPTEMSIYYDTLYRTFLFVPGTPATIDALEGVVTTSNGQPAVGRDVIVAGNGFIYHTVTNSKGRYRVFRSLSGPVRIQVAGVTKQLNQLPATRKFDIVVPH